MRKTITALAAIAALIGTLTACGNGATSQSDDAGSSESRAEALPADEPDPDTDGDGVPDAEDVFLSDPDEWADDDGNGVGDNEDAEVAQAKAEARARRQRQAAQQRKIDGAVAPSERQWAQVVKNPDAHTGEFYRVYGQIWQFDAATGADTFLATTANRNTMSYGFFDGDDAMFVGTAKKFKPYVEDDVFVATVQVAGSFSYDTQAGGNNTVPLLKVHRIALD